MTPDPVLVGASSAAWAAGYATALGTIPAPPGAGWFGWRFTTPTGPDHETYVQVTYQPDGLRIEYMHLQYPVWVRVIPWAAP